MVLILLQQRLYSRVALYYQRYRTRRELARADEHILKDIGINRCQAELEARKPFWRE